MNRKSNYMIGTAICIACIVAAGCGGFIIGKRSADKQYQAGSATAIEINRSDFQLFEAAEKPIYVTGHKSPDSDTVGCAIGYAKLLEKLGYDAEPIVLGQINNETKYILNTAGVKEPKLMEDVSGCSMVLVDHSEYTQAADGLENAQILGIIDHHGVGTVTTGSPLLYEGHPFGSAATIVWMCYQKYGVQPDPQTAFVMMGAILSDTRNLQSNTTFADREALKALSSLAGMTDTDAFYQEMYKAAVSYEGMTDEEIYFSDYKEYEKGGRTFAIACMNAYDEVGAKELAERMKNVLPDALASTGMEMAFVQINIMRDDVSCTYFLPSDETADEVLQAAFQDETVYDGTLYKHEPCASRKSDIVPAITSVLEGYPKE